MAAAAPLFTLDKCFYSDPSRGSSTFDCEFIASPTGANKQRLCWCHLPPPTLPPPTFGVCSNPVWNKRKCGEGITSIPARQAKKYPRLQRFDHPSQGDVCYHKKWPKNRSYECPKDCEKVLEKNLQGEMIPKAPFCKNQDGDACRVPFPGGSSLN